MKRPEADERTQFWLNTFHLATRGRPYAYGAPLPLKPLDILDLVDRLSLPAEPEEAVAIVCAMDDCWIKWKDGQKSSKTKAA